MWPRQCGAGHAWATLDPRRATAASLLLRRVAPPRHVPRAHYAKRKTLDTFTSKKVNYYDALKLTPKATQAQVKEAYYRLSKKYHPDQYRGDEDPTKKFREIKEAYEVLGNFQQRKMYDRGLLGVTPAATPEEAEEYSSKFYESRHKRGHVPTGTGRTPIYNFDEWAKTHYQTTRQRREDSKMRYEQILRDRVIDEEERKTQSIVSLLALSGLMVIIYYVITVDYDAQAVKSLKKSDGTSNKR